MSIKVYRWEFKHYNLDCCDLCFTGPYNTNDSYYEPSIYEKLKKTFKNELNSQISFSLFEHMDKNHPTPYIVFIESNLTDLEQEHFLQLLDMIVSSEFTNINGQTKCAFYSIDDMNKWFSKNEQYIMQILGYNFVEYEIDNSKEYYFLDILKTQILFSDKVVINKTILI